LIALRLPGLHDILGAVPAEAASGMCTLQTG
jgi:hypothetical protein